jgi:hypothetical protein
MLKRLIDKLFLIKEIRSKLGVLHFRRYQLLKTPWFKVYLHHILQSDQDKHMHDHPFNFTSFILRGGYREDWAASPYWSDIKERYVTAGSLVRHDHTDAHKLTLTTPQVWSLVFVSGETWDWGYQTERGWMQHETYRAHKNAGYFNDHSS